MYTILRLTDRDTIRTFLGQDRQLTAYALGDLDDAFWPDSVFLGAELNGALVAVVLLYRGLDPAVLTAFGDVEGVRAIFNDYPLPAEVYYLMIPALREVLAEKSDLTHVSQEWRMVLDQAAFTAPDMGQVARLGPEHAGALAELFRGAADPGEEVLAFSPWQIAHGVFYGIWEQGALVATAGTHVWSLSESLTAIGNVFTLPEHRGRGYATVCTAAVAAEAMAAGLETIVLNVRHDNAPAIHVYEKLGFRKYGLFLEGPGVRR